jgi:hypothetical protein
MNESIYAIVIIAVAIQIIFLLKWWMMSNDVNFIKNKIDKHNSDDELMRYIILGKKDKVKEIIVDRFIEKSKTNFDYAKKRCKKYFDLIGEEMPQMIAEAKSLRDVDIDFIIAGAYKKDEVKREINNNIVQTNIEKDNTDDSGGKVIAIVAVVIIIAILILSLILGIF